MKVISLSFFGVNNSIMASETRVSTSMISIPFNINYEPLRIHSSMRALMRRIEKWKLINFKIFSVMILMFRRQKVCYWHLFKNNAFDSLKKIPTLHGTTVNRPAAVPPLRLFHSFIKILNNDHPIMHFEVEISKGKRKILTHWII